MPNNNERPPIMNDISLYADDIDAMLDERIKNEAEERKNMGKKTVNKKGDTLPDKTIADLPSAQYGYGQAQENLKKAAEEKLNYLNSTSVEEEHNQRVAELQEHNRSNGAGFVPIPVKDLPTKGYFYPVGTKIYAKAASLGDIKHWSLMDDTDLSAVDDGINSIIESCITIVFPTSYEKNATWRDLKEIDRLYLVLAVHDFTFPPSSGNDIRVNINETANVLVQKDNIEFIKFGDKLMKYYNPDKLCFSFPAKAKCFKGGTLDLYLPACGVTRWIKEYLQARQQRQEGYDEDFLSIAALLIPDHRGLNTDKYYEIIDSSAEWTAYEWALISKVKKVIETAITPKLHYKDEAGADKEAPLNFRGGFKAIFQPNLDIDL